MPRCAGVQDAAHPAEQMVLDVVDLWRRRCGGASTAGAYERVKTLRDHRPTGATLAPESMENPNTTLWSARRDGGRSAEQG